MSQLNRTRVNNVLKRMAEAGVEQMIVTSPISIFYLTGEMVHPGERCLALYLAAARRACDERLDFRGYDPHGQGR